MMYGCYLAVKRWSPDFNPRDPSFGRTMVWVRFSGLNAMFYHPSALRAIASSIGKLVKLDVMTEEVGRANFARVCVELDLASPVIREIWIEDHWHPVEYENLHLVCGECDCFGHVTRNCTRKEGKNQEHDGEKPSTAENPDGGRSEGPSGVTRGAPQPDSNLVSNSNADLNADSQGWTLVQNQRKSRNFKGKNKIGIKGHVHGKLHGDCAESRAIHTHVELPSKPRSGPSVSKSTIIPQQDGLTSDGTKVIFRAVKPDKVVKGGRMVTVQR